MKLLIDMNLSPGWVEHLYARGIDAVHWSTVGDPRAPDAALMRWASEHGRVVLTRDVVTLNERGTRVRILPLRP